MAPLTVSTESPAASARPASWRRVRKRARAQAGDPAQPRIHRRRNRCRARICRRSCRKDRGLPPARGGPSGRRYRPPATRHKARAPARTAWGCLRCDPSEYVIAFPSAVALRQIRRRVSLTSLRLRRREVSQASSMAPQRKKATPVFLIWIKFSNIRRPCRLLARLGGDLMGTGGSSSRSEKSHGAR